MSFRPFDELKLGDFGWRGSRICCFCGSLRVAVRIRPGLIDSGGRVVRVLFCQACKSNCGRV